MTTFNYKQRETKTISKQILLSSLQNKKRMLAKFSTTQRKNQDPAKVQLENKNRCWIALKYTKSKKNTIIPTHIGPNNKIAIKMR